MTEHEFIGYSFKVVLPIVISLLPLTALIWKLCANITTLNVSIQEMNERNSIRDKRLDSHSTEMHNLKDGIIENKLQLSEHEIRIRTLEEKEH